MSERDTSALCGGAGLRHRAGNAACWPADSVGITGLVVLLVGARGRARLLSSRRSRSPTGLRETINGLYKTELIYGPDQGPWRTLEQVELATLSWVHWFNTARLHSYCNDEPPAEFEAAYAAQQADQPLVGTQ